jgi:type IV pilus assembly protein PilX
MSATGFSRPSRSARREQGFVLITGMLFLVVMTLLGLALFRSTGLMDRITANTRDKQRSFEAAEGALEYAAWWLGSTNGGGAASTCSANSGATVATIHVCSEALAPTYPTFAAIAGLGWAPKAFSYTPPNMTVAAGGGLNAAGTDINYQAPPGVYVESLGLSSDGKSMFYQATAYGYGGDSNTVSVVRATFKRTAKSTSLKAP